MKCPLPALMSRKALARLATGTKLSVLADDPMAAVDRPHMCHGERHAVEGVTPRERLSEFTPQSARSSAAARHRYA